MVMIIHVVRVISILNIFRINFKVFICSLPYRFKTIIEVNRPELIFMTEPSLSFLTWTVFKIINNLLFHGCYTVNVGVPVT